MHRTPISFSRHPFHIWSLPWTAHRLLSPFAATHLARQTWNRECVDCERVCIPHTTRHDITRQRKSIASLPQLAWARAPSQFTAICGIATAINMFEYTYTSQNITARHIHVAQWVLYMEQAASNTYLLQYYVGGCFTLLLLLLRKCVHASTPFYSLWESMHMLL